MMPMLTGVDPLFRRDPPAFSPNGRMLDENERTPRGV